MSTPIRRPRRQGAKCFRVCIECGTRRQIPWHLRLAESHQDDVYVCKFCNPPQGKPRGQNFDQAEYSRNWNLQRRYGISAKQYDELLTAQGGACAICRKPPKVRMLPVDHDHVTGRVRGLLCVSCNSKVEWLVTYGEAVRRYLAGDWEASQYVQGLITKAARA